MNDIEDRLRTTLHELADTVPSSPHARADLDHRLARRGSRRPVLIAAAAAVVVAAVVVPVALTQGGDQQASQVTTTPSSTSTPPNGDLTVPIELARFDDNGVNVAAVLSITAKTDGEQWCIDVHGPLDYRTTYPGYCEIVPNWPAANPPGDVVLTRALLGDGKTLYSGPTPNLMLFITSPQVTSLEVREGYGTPVTVKQVTKTPSATYYLADFPETPAGFGYTAWDAAGNVLVDAIT